jgi:integrase
MAMPWRKADAPRKKAANGLGSGIHYRESRRHYTVAVTVGGKRVQRVASTPAEAVEIRNRLLADDVDGLAPSDGTETVADFFERWLTDTLPRSVAPSTMRNYRDVVNAYVIPHLGRVQLAKLTPAHVDRMMRRLEEEGRSPRTVALARTVLRRGLGVAVRQRAIRTNVVMLTDAPKGTPPRIDDAMTAEEVGRVLAAARGDRLEALAFLVLGVGLRRSEALSLTWDDVDLDEGYLRVTTAKTAAGLRPVPLPEPVVVALVAHRKAQAAEELATTSWADGDLVFTTRTGTAIDGRNCLRWWHGLTERAGVGRRRFHASRHTAATLMLANGTSLEVVSRTLGHSSLAITADVYAKVLPPAQREAADAMAEVLRPVEVPVRATGRRRGA